MNRFQASSAGLQSDWNPILQSIYGFLNPIHQNISSVRISVEWDWKARVPTTEFQAPKVAINSGCSADLTNHYIRPVAYIFMIQGFKDADGAAGGDLGGNSGHEFLERSWANESQGNGENFCMHSANLTSSSQVGKSFDFLEANQDMSQTTRLSDEDATGSFSPILVYSKSLRPSIEVLTLNF
jgi:hypothetical protein